MNIEDNFIVLFPFKSLIIFSLLFCYIRFTWYILTTLPIKTNSKPELYSFFPNTTELRKLKLVILGNKLISSTSHSN